MKQLLSFIVCCLIGASSAAQDIILKRNAEQIEAVVKEITDTDVKYRKFTHTEGVTYSIRRSEVFSITYENGTKDLFADENRRLSPRAIPTHPFPAAIRSESCSMRAVSGALSSGSQKMAGTDCSCRSWKEKQHGVLLTKTH